MHSFSTRSLKATSPLGLKQRQRHYDAHIKKIIQIEKAQNTKRILAAQSRIAHNLKKSKQVNRKFRAEEEDRQRKQEDMKMIKTLIEITKKPRIKTEAREEQHSRLDFIGNRSTSKDHLMKKDRISTQNIRLAKSILESACQVKQYKKKMRTQIDQYLKLRNHMQKYRQSQTHRPSQPKRPSKTANQLLSIIRQKTEEIRRNQSRANINTQQSKESQIAQKEQELLL